MYVEWSNNFRSWNVKPRILVKTNTGTYLPNLHDVTFPNMAIFQT